MASRPRTHYIDPYKPFTDLCYFGLDGCTRPACSCSCHTEQFIPRKPAREYLARIIKTVKEWYR